MSATAILSPHPDDAVLSCWHTLTGPGEVAVINMFAGIPGVGVPISWWDSLTGASDPVRRMHERLEEDQRALALAGRTAINLGFLDDQYRAHGPELDEVLAELRALLAPGTLLLAPAGIGAHPDHLLARAAALRLLDAGVRVALYADLPHAIQRGWPPELRPDGRAKLTPADIAWQVALAKVGPLLAEPTVCRLSPRQRRRKLEALSAYETQLDALNAIAFKPLDRAETLRYEVVWKLPGDGTALAQAARQSPAEVR